jgi:hypothetical protein
MDLYDKLEGECNKHFDDLQSEPHFGLFVPSIIEMRTLNDVCLISTRSFIASFMDEFIILDEG